MDTRRLGAERDPDAERIAQECAGYDLENFLVLAPAVLRIHEKASFVYHGCSSIQQYALRFLNLDGKRAWQAVQVGRALRAYEGLGDQIRRGEISLRSAEALGKLLGVPGALPESEREAWRTRAARTSPEDFAKEVLRKVEATRQGAPVVPVTVAVTLDTKEKFDRARTIASERADRVLTEGETFSLVLDHYLDAFDPERHPRGKRRLGPTSERPLDRYVPVEVQRAVRARAGNQCEVGCGHRMFLGLAHFVPHASGTSGREVHDLFLPCGACHRLYDCGLISFFGWENGKPVFVTVDGEILGPPGMAKASEPRGYPPLEEAPGGSDDPAGQVAERPPPGWFGPGRHERCDVRA
jgi:hypothetical protein